MTDIERLERDLKAANERLDVACKALAPRHKGGEWEEFDAASESVLRLERQLAATRGEEYADVLEFPVKWDIGAPLPQLLVNDYRALLAFLMNEPDPNWDGSYVTIKDPVSDQFERIAVVEFEHCISAKLGGPNDEVFEGHPLSGRGLKAYTAQLVVNSRWIKELETINSVHSMYRSDYWRDLKHFVFWFHDSTFECVAKAFRVDTFRASMKAVLAQMVDRLIR
jgi:hypothetical protein